MRFCPLCSSDKRTPLHAFPLTYGGVQSIYLCSCGFVYSSIPHPVDYQDQSIYSLPGALGSGVSRYDKERLAWIPKKVEETLDIPHDALILDIGCAQGGLLEAFRDRGYYNLNGLDPSPACVETVQAKGFWAIKGGLGDPGLPLTQFDLITLSHVLEHVENIQDALTWVRRTLAPDGLTYIEVPNAGKYYEFPLPFLDFNSEHINHFSLAYLISALECVGFEIAHAGERTITLTNGSPYPAIWVVARKKAASLGQNIQAYISLSKQALSEMNAKLERELGDATEVIMWGAGEYMTHIANLHVFRKVKIVQVVDRNPSLHGRIACGMTVDPPYLIQRTNIPIVIASLVAVEAITRDARKMGLTNQIVGVI